MASSSPSLRRGGSLRSDLPRELTELCRAGLDAVSFRRELRARLERLIAFDAYCVNTVDPTTLLVTSSIGDGLSRPAARRLFELEARGDDFNRLSELAGARLPFATIHASTAGQPQLSARMRELFLPLGLGDELRVALRSKGQCWGYLHLFRSARQQPFRAHELARCLPAFSEIGDGLRRACLRPAQQPVSPSLSLLQRTPDGELVADRAVLETLRHHFPTDVGGDWPHALHAVGERAGAANANAQHHTSTGWIQIHGVALADSLTFVLSRPHPTSLAPLLFLAHGLTERERQIAALLLRGHDNDAIAAALGISRYTTKDHVKAIFSKTRATDRVSFSALLSGA